MLSRMMFLLGSLCLLPGALAAQPPDTAAFPASWAGIWAGDLDIYNERGLAQSVPMQLRILPQDSAGVYTWTLIYGADTVAGRRPYLLRTLDPARGRYLIDEQNSIAMENYLLGGKLYGRFEVQGILLLASVEKRGEELYYEIISGKKDPVSTTGDQVFDGEHIPPVYAYPVAVRQAAVLRRR